MSRNTLLRKKNPFLQYVLPIAVPVLLLAAIIFAVIHFGFSPKSKPSLSNHVISSSKVNSSKVSSVQSSSAVSSSVVSSSSIPSSTAAASSAVSAGTSSAAANFAVNPAWPAYTKDDYKYFDGSMFVGDSLTNDISFYKLMNNASIVASIGLSTYEAVAKQHKIMGQNVYVTDLIAQKKPQKLYIMLGTNDLQWMTDDKYRRYYNELLDKIKSVSPSTVVYMESILPVTTGYETKNPHLANANIDRFNEILKSICTERGLKYMDIASVFKGPDGKLPTQASDDGLHLKPGYYTRWFSYLLSNK